MTYLLDTNVLDEIKHIRSIRSRKKGTVPNRGVVRFFLSAHEDELFVAPQVIGELYYGAINARRLGQDAIADEQQEFANMMADNYQDRIIDFDAASAKVWVKAHQSGNGGDPHLIDKQIAAIGIAHGKIVVTRDIKPNRGLNCTAWGAEIVTTTRLGLMLSFPQVGLILLNPFSAGPQAFIPTMAA